MNIADRLREARSISGLSQVDAATKYGLTLSSYKKYEAGSVEPGSAALASIAEAGINPYWLLIGKGEMLLADMQPPQHQDYASIPSLGELDTQRLQLAIETIEEVLEESGRKITPAKKAEAIKLAYEIFEDEDKEKDAQSFEHAQKILSKIIKSIA